MAYDRIEPTITTNDRGEDVYTHPAYGQISVSRRQGGRFGLYGTEFEHNSTIAIAIHSSEMHRHLSRDWHHTTRVIAEVVLSEAQWATFVSSLNTGSGVPATISFSEKGGLRPGIAVRTTKGLYEKEANAKIANIVDQLDQLRDKLTSATSGISKVKAKELLEHLRVAKQEIAQNLDFVADSFGEHMEDVVSQAKIEVDAHINSAIHRAGIAAIEGQQLLRIGGDKDASTE